MENCEYEVIIIGGSYAGLSAAMSLGRSLRKTLIIDGGEPCNRQTPRSHNFLTQDGRTSKEISGIARQQVREYKTIEFYSGLAIQAQRLPTGFELSTDKGDRFKAEKLIFATGIQDLKPDYPGFAECWGISVVHCPYCHGYEIRGKKTALIANGFRAIHLASLVNNLTGEISIVTSKAEEFANEQLNKLQAHGIGLIEKEIERIEHQEGRLDRIVFRDGHEEAFDAAYAALPFEQNSILPMDLGCELTEEGYIKVDTMQKTTQEGIFACGDNSTMVRSIANAVYSGNIAGALVNMELTEEHF